MLTNYTRHQTAWAAWVGPWMALFFVAGGGNAQEPKMLFTVVDASKVKLTEKQEKILDRYRKMPTTLTLHLVQFHHEALTNTPALNIPLNGKTIQIQDYTVTKEDDAEFLVWKGKGPEYSVDVSIRGQIVRARILNGKELYSVESLGAGLQMLIHLDQSKFPMDDPPQNPK